MYHEYLQKLVPRMIHSKPHKRPRAGVICEEMLKIWPDPENPLTLRLQKEQEERQMRARGIDPLDPHAMLINLRLLCDLLLVEAVLCKLGERESSLRLQIYEQKLFCERQTY